MEFPMATITDIHQPRRAGILALVAAPFKAIFVVLTAIAEAHPRYRELQKLQQMSDEQLAKRGLTRDTIVHHVFRDRFHL
jgi:uncharacterized protein YjiS (DUF1127 family)